MAYSDSNFVLQNPKSMVLGEALAYTFDFSAVGTPASEGTCFAFDADGTDVSSGVLTGNAQLNGSVVTFKLFTPASAQKYRLVSQVVISGNTVKGILDVGVFATAPDYSSLAVDTNSYGTPAGVAVWVPKFTNKAGTFDDTTNPTLPQLIAWIDQVSSLINAQLATDGFTIPVSEPTVVPMLTAFVEQEVGAMVEGVNGSGRLGPRALRQRGGGTARWEMLNADVMAFLSSVKVGLEQQGAERTRDFTSGLGFREFDESGDTVEPLFQREGFGETYKKWDQ